MKTFRNIMLIAVIVIFVLAVGMFYAPGFLAYSTNYAKVDAVILLLGPDFSARQKHARDLIEKGMADYLIIPAYGKTYYVDQGIMKLLQGDKVRDSRDGKKNSLLEQYYEDTHLELMKAKNTMKMGGQKSAIFVSSSYHMRRIRLMVDKEFGHQSVYYFSPTPYDPAPVCAWQLKASDWKKVWREYVKILWFMIYSPWTK
ncbi:MAG: YdcF family protein [Deltaproteobacteria bacterium]